jgi:hypothetical protein
MMPTALLPLLILPLLLLQIGEVESSKKQNMTPLM